MAAPALRYEIVDVFTDRPFAGNPLAVVLDADDLDTAQMQVLAKEFNLSETAFPIRPDADGIDYRLRIFTPEIELPFAGHPSVGTAWLMATLGRVGGQKAGELTVVQRCGAGDLPLRVERDESGRPGRVHLTGGSPTLGEPIDPGPLLEIAGLDQGDLAGAPPRLAGAGLTWSFLLVNDEAVARAIPNVAALRAAPPDVIAAGLFLVSWDGTTAHARGFAGDIGVPEDPATGSASLGLGVYLVGSELLPADGASDYLVRQGIEMGRPSRIFGTVEAESGRVTRVEVAGDVRPIARGEIAVPAPR